MTFAFGELKTSQLQSIFNVRPFRKHGNKTGNVAYYADKARTSGEGLRRRRAGSRDGGDRKPAVAFLASSAGMLQLPRAEHRAASAMWHRYAQNMWRNILEVCAMASRGKAFLDILQPRAILIYDEAEVGTTKGRARRRCPKSLRGMGWRARRFLERRSPGVLKSLLAPSKAKRLPAALRNKRHAIRRSPGVLQYAHELIVSARYFCRSDRFTSRSAWNTLP